jgi:hypothetical protein
MRYCTHIPCGMWHHWHVLVSRGSCCFHVNQHVFTIIGRVKDTKYLPKVVAASHFSLLIVIRSLTCLPTCRALTVAVVYACTVCQSRLWCVLGSFRLRGALRMERYCIGRYRSLLYNAIFIKSETREVTIAWFETRAISSHHLHHQHPPTHSSSHAKSMHYKAPSSDPSSIHHNTIQ